MPRARILDSLFSCSRELLRASSPDELHRLVVELGRAGLGLDRVALFLHDPISKEMRGSWGIDERGELVDESGRSLPLPVEEGVFPANQGSEWSALIALREGQRLLGWLAADNLLTRRPLSASRREDLLLYATIVSRILALGVEEALPPLGEMSKAQNSLMERLFTIFAHDLRGPLGTVRNLLLGILQDPADFTEEEIRSYLPEMHRSIDSAYALLDNLLDWLRSQMDEIGVLVASVDPADLIEDVAASLSEAAVAKGLSLRIEKTQALGVRSDRLMIEAILRNFLSNAIKFSPRGGEVRISAVSSAESPVLRISVSDRGMGMDEQILSTLFSIDSAKKRRGSEGERGSGIGLMFCRDLASRLGATIQVESRSGQGSVFTLVLPDQVEGELPGAS